MKIRTPLDVHEAAVERWYGRGQSGEMIRDPAIAALSAAVKTARTSADSLSALAEALADDRTVTPEVGALRLRDRALDLAKTAATRLDAAREQAQQGIDAMDQRTGAPPRPARQRQALNH